MRLFPAAFRARRGEAMADTFQDACQEHRARGLRSLLGFLTRTTLDLATSGFRERLSLAARRRPRVGNGALKRGLSIVSWLDVKLGLRMLVKYPALTLVSTFALAVGVPVGLAPDHFVDGITAPLPVPEGERIRLLRLWSAVLGRAESTSYQDFERWSGALASFEVVAAFRRTRYNVDAGEEARAGVRAAEMTPSAFDLLRVGPLLGRTLQPEDASPGAPDVVAVGYDLWQARYAADPPLVGRTIRLGAVPYTVVGVMPEGFFFPTRESLWTPLRAPEEARSASAPVRIIGRLADGVTDAEAGAELAVVAGRAEFPGAERRVRPQVATYAHILVPGLDGGLRQSYEVLLFRSLAWLVLLVACGNVGMLVFARSATRAGELAVRTALGASRTRIIAQAFVESLLLALLAAGAGLLLMGLVLELMWQVLPAGLSETLPYWIDWRIDGGTVVHALVLAGLSAVVAGMVPAIRYTGRSVQATVQEARAGRGGRRFGSLSGVFIVADIAVAVAAVGFALTASDLLTRSGESEELVGIPASEYLAAAVHLAPERQEEAAVSAEVERMAKTQEDVVRSIRAEPGVRAVVVADALPRMEHASRIVEVEGIEAPEGRKGVNARVARVSPGFFSSMGTPVLGGRAFDPSDIGEERSAVIVNTTFVEQVLQGQNALGRRLRFHPWGEGEPGRWKEIVGVVGHLGMRITSPENSQGVYEPFAPGELETVQLGIHLGPDPSSFAPRLRAIAGDVDPTAIVSVTGRLDEVREGDWYLLLAASLGASLLVGVLLALAASGIYAIMSFAVTERTTEIGIRAALGAGRRRLVVAVIRRAILQLGIGVVLGLPVAALFLHSDEGPPYVGAGKALAVGVAILLLVGLAACTGPTLRALRVEPSEALRAEG